MKNLASVPLRPTLLLLGFASEEAHHGFGITSCYYSAATKICEWDAG